MNRQTSKRLSVGVLLYGDEPGLADRCLGSLAARLEDGSTHIADIRLGLNEISRSTRRIVEGFVSEAGRRHRIPVISYDCVANAHKYPLMRKMLLSDPRPPAQFTMWFDDDSYLDGPPGWWTHVLAVSDEADMLGKIYYRGLQGRQWDWITHQDWYNPSAGKPVRRYVRRTIAFATGGWWVIRTELLRQWNWPSPELKHCGGDSMLGELLRHQGCRLKNFEDGVRINADDRGRHSKARPRGESWNRVLLGIDGWSPRVDLGHQDFSVVMTFHAGN